MTARARGTTSYSIYDAGTAMFVYLVRDFGADRFVQYYGQARDTQDPEVFRVDFESFWGISIETAWVEMFETRDFFKRITPICPCTQPELVPLDGSLIAATSRPIHPLPDADPGPYLFVADYDVALSNCAQDVRGIRLASPEANMFRRSGITAARLLPERHYVRANRGSSVSARKGNFVAGTCAEAEPIAVPPGFVGALNVTASREAGDTSSPDWYTRFTFADAPRTVIANDAPFLAVCPSCTAVDQDCTPLTSDPPLVVGQDLIIRARNPALAVKIDKPEEVTSTITVLPP